MIRVTIALLLFLAGSAAQAQFTVYREFLFSGQPSEAYFDGLGMKRSHGVYEAEVTGGTASVKQNLMVSTAQRTASNYQLYQSRMWYDIEYLSCDSFNVGRAQAIANADTLAKYIHWAKQAAPALQIGMYSIVPVADPYIFTHLAQRQSANNLIQRLADSLDYLCPSLYLFYSESTLPYANYAVPMVQEARRMAKGKKVFAFVAPGYHDAGDHDGQYASKAVWANVLNTLKNSGADGIIIFAGKGAMGSQPYNWSYIDTCGWWQATKEFLAAESGTITPPPPSPPAAPTIISPVGGQVIDPAGWTSVWRKVAGAVKYHFQLATTSSFASAVISDSSITDTTRGLGNLANGTTYYIHVRAKGSSGWGAYGSAMQFSTGAPPPTIVDPLPGTKHNGTSIRTRWNRTSGATAYHLQVAGTTTFAALEIDDSTITDTSKYVTLANAGAQYYCRIRAMTVTGWTAWSDVSDFSTGASSTVDKETGVPSSFALAQNYPNPFNPLTIIKYTIAGPGGSGLGASKTMLVVYDVLGREVATLVDDMKAAGSYEVRFDASRLASGIYIYRLTAGSFTQAKTMLLVK